MIKWNEIRVGDIVSFNTKPHSSLDIKCFLVLELYPIKEGHTDFRGINLETMEYDQCGIIGHTEKYWDFVARIDDDA